MKIIAGIGANGRLNSARNYHGLGNFDSQPPTNPVGFLLRTEGGDRILRQAAGDKILIAEGA